MENDSLPKIKKGNPHNAESAKKANSIDTEKINKQVKK
jgi:hypothetical protein